MKTPKTKLRFWARQNSYRSGVPFYLNCQFSGMQYKVLFNKNKTNKTQFEALDRELNTDHWVHVTSMAGY